MRQCLTSVWVARDGQTLVKHWSNPLVKHWSNPLVKHGVYSSPPPLLLEAGWGRLEEEGV